MKKSVAEIQNRLESPDCKKIFSSSLIRFFRLTFTQKMLRRESDNLARDVDALQDEIFAQTLTDTNKNIYRTREVYDIIRRQYFGLNKEYEKNLELKFDFQKRIISPQRAISMAKNIFVGGDLKRLRATIRQYKKDEQRLAQNIFAFNQRENIFQNRDWSVVSPSIFAQEKYLLTKQKRHYGDKHRGKNFPFSNRSNRNHHILKKTPKRALRKIAIISRSVLSSAIRKPKSISILAMK